MKYYGILKDKIWNKYGVILGYKKEKSAKISVEKRIKI